jgi:hypothetical protein
MEICVDEVFDLYFNRYLSYMMSSWQLAEVAFVHGGKCDFISIFTSQIEKMSL